MNNTHWNRLIAQLPDDARYGYKELQLTETQLSDYEYVYALIADFMRSKKYEVKAYPHGLKWLLKDEAKHILEKRIRSRLATLPTFGLGQLHQCYRPPNQLLLLPKLLHLRKSTVYTALIGQQFN